MPELPDVEGFKRHLARHARGRRVERVTALDATVIRNTSSQGLGRSLHHRVVATPERRGKWLLAHTDGPTMLLHFGMTGALSWSSRPGAPHRFDRVLFDLEGGRLAYRTQRKLGGIWLARTSAELDDITGALGPDADDVDRDLMGELLDGRRGGAKAVLMDQTVLAGVGNELSDEILWRARIHPATSVADLDEDELDAIHHALEEVTRASKRHGRIPTGPDWLESVRGEDDPCCPRCGAPVEKIRSAGRTAYVCTEEQRRRR